MNNINWKNASPEQKNFWDRNKGKIAWNTLTPFYFHGAIAASEFLVYAAAKYYIALEFSVFYLNASNVALQNLTLYDEANAVQVLYTKNSIYWDATAAGAKYLNNPIFLKNVSFSRIATNLLLYMRFNGYRLTIV